MQSYRPDIDGLRMVAIMPVVLYHAGVPWVSGGFVGVDIFFVISGFLITRLLLDDLAHARFSLIGFYERRARRILPALFTVIIVTFIIGSILLLPKQFVEFSHSSIATVIFVSNFWFWRTTSNYFSPEAEFHPLLHTWSLAVEEQFYLLFPLLLLALARGSHRRILWAVSALTGVSFVLSIIGVARSPAASFYLAPLRGWELGLGAMLALGLVPNLSARWLREAIASGGLAAILIAVVFYDASTPFPGFAAALPCLGAAALITAGSQGSSFASRALSFKPAVFIGLISYSLYLWHWPILVFMRIYVGDVALPAGFATGAVALAFMAAVISWNYVERPFRRRSTQGFGRTAIFAMSGTAMAAVVAVSAAIWIGGGLATRFPSEVLAAYAGAHDTNPDRDRCLRVLPKSGLCRFGAETDPEAPVDFLLWGDSHASAVMPGIAAAAREAGKTGIFAGLPACPPLLRVQRADRDPGHDCAGFAEAVLAELQARKDSPLVILVARWVLVAEGRRGPNEYGEPVLLAWADTDNTGPFHPEGNFDIFQQAAAETIAAIRSTGRQVIILGNVPEIGWNVPRRLAGHIRWGHRLPPTPTAETVNGRQGRTDSVLADLAQATGVRVLPLTYLFCDPTCRTHHEGRPLYRDDDHLSRYGAIKFIGPLFKEKVWN